jgi:hypothetical protein
VHHFVLSICKVTYENICGQLILLCVLFLGFCPAQDNVSTGRLPATI